MLRLTARLLEGERCVVLTSFQDEARDEWRVYADWLRRQARVVDPRRVRVRDMRVDLVGGGSVTFTSNHARADGVTVYNTFMDDLTGML